MVVNMMSQAGQIFIGRKPEMAVLTAALDAALSGQGRLVMLAGDPGIGKTRTAQELASLAESKGARVLWGWCYERDSADARRGTPLTLMCFCAGVGCVPGPGLSSTGAPVAWWEVAGELMRSICTRVCSDSRWTTAETCVWVSV